MTAPAGHPSVRAGAPADLAGLLELEEAAFETDRLDRRAFQHALRSPTILVLVAEGDEGDGLAGYALVQVRRGSRVGRLTSLAVKPGGQGRGLGRALMRAAEEAALAAGCDRLRLEVRADNERARRLYEKAAYDALGVTPDYYEDGAAAHRYEKRI